MSEQRTLVICKSCGTRKDVSINECLAGGWPRHCGATMSLDPETPADKFGKAVDGIMEPVDLLLEGLQRHG